MIQEVGGVGVAATQQSENWKAKASENRQPKTAITQQSEIKTTSRCESDFVGRAMPDNPHRWRA